MQEVSFMRFMHLSIEILPKKGYTYNRQKFDFNIIKSKWRAVNEYDSTIVSKRKNKHSA